ncbi:uncharacterized protein DS421_1g24980 [Arachis hypogaea]|nr:uncharacterized protein DS421_1g24980 [Arachis hypogaea]
MLSISLTKFGRLVLLSRPITLRTQFMNLEAIFLSNKSYTNKEIIPKKKKIILAK